jgi:hypothetical protein
MRIEYYANGRKRRVTVRRPFESSQPTERLLAVMQALRAGPLTAGMLFSAPEEETVRVVPVEAGTPTVIPTETMSIGRARNSEVAWLRSQFGMEVVEEAATARCSWLRHTMATIRFDWWPERSPRSLSGAESSVRSRLPAADGRARADHNRSDHPVGARQPRPARHDRCRHRSHARADCPRRSCSSCIRVDTGRSGGRSVLDSTFART